MEFHSKGMVSKGNAAPQQFAILINTAIPDMYAPGHFCIAANGSITPLTFVEFMEFTAKFDSGELFRGARWFKPWGANHSGMNFPRLLPRRNRNTYRNSEKATRSHNRNLSRNHNNRNNLRPTLTIESAIAATNQIRMSKQIPLPPPPVALQRTGKQKLLFGP